MKQALKGILEVSLPYHKVAAFVEVLQPTWVFWKELSLVQMNFEKVMRNDEHHR